jgi:parallel beta-helix repeat protein
MNIVILSAIMMIIATIQLSCVSGYEEIMTFDQNSTPILDSCSRIVWYPDVSEGYISPPALRSGPIRNSGISCVEKTVVGPANINFFWKVDQDKNRIGELSFKVDNQIILLCTSSHWSPVSYAVAPGTHTLSWEYRRYHSYPEFSGAGWIDDVNIIYENGTPFILTGPEKYIFDQQLSSIEKNISLIENRLKSFDSLENITKYIVDQQLASIKKNLSMIEDGLESFDSLRNITNDIVFINNDRNVNLTKEINKYKNKIIVLDSGIYHTGGVTINTSDVHIMPKIKWKTVLDSDGAQRGIMINNSRNITLDSLIIQNDTCGIRIENCGDIAIRENIITGFSMFGIRIVNSNSTKIEQNRLATDNCNDINAIYIFNGSKNILSANSVYLPPCGDITKRFLYSLDNSSANYIEVINDGYIRENGVKCRIFSNKNICYYCGTMPEIPANLSDKSKNIWSFLAYDSLDDPSDNP